jgi:hypothetical protein
VLVVVGARPGRDLLTAPGHPDAVGAHLGVVQVQVDAPSQPRRLGPGGGHGAAPAGEPGQGGQHPEVDAEAGVDLADVVEEGGGEPAMVAGVRRTLQHRVHPPGHGDGVALVVVGHPLEDAPLGRGEHLLHPGPVVAADGDGGQGAEVPAGEVAPARGPAGRQTPHPAT